MKMCLIIRWAILRCPAPEHFTKTCIDLLQTKEPVTLHGYSPTLTIPAVRKAVAESLNRRFGMDYGMEHIFMATGAAGALAHAMRCVAVPGAGYYHLCAVLPGIQAVCGGRGPESEGRSAPHEGFPD